ncbi:SCO0607 family lipoprotein [Streptomyces sp. NPDC059002]|uniref:SCO0607 family lipoprotein n=1 Tax=Streptomyces sp. NPDC059002 TaxID=3346690 RepID=UPI0036A052F8
MPSTHRPCRPTATRRAGGARAAAAALVGVAAVVALTGCSAFEYREDICSDGEYPVMTVGDTGSACVANGEQPPTGFTRYPEGKVPQQVDDTWDVYWRTHTLDKDGNIIDAPDAG